jgi:hypothetical protein
MNKEECNHQWTLDDAAGADSGYTQLWWGCPNCFATRHTVLNIALSASGIAAETAVSVVKDYYTKED